MSPILFNLSLEKIVREATIDREGVSLKEKDIETLAYTHDMVLVIESKDKLKKTIKHSLTLQNV